MIFKSLFTAFLCAAAVISTAGCGSLHSGKEEASGLNKDPVTVTVGLQDSFLPAADFNRYITQPVQAKYPWITVQSVPYAKGSQLPDLVAAGQTPDILIISNIATLFQYFDLGLDNPLDDMIKKYNLDLNRFEPEALDAIKVLSAGKNGLYGIPYQRHFSAMYYNKDIFDKFGVGYPKDNLTWDATYQLALKLTRKEGNTQYRGLEPDVSERAASQLSIPFIDPKTNKAVLDTEQWKNVLEFLYKVHQIPGNEQIAFYATGLFVKDRTLAMFPSVNILPALANVPDLNWDMVSYPTWPQAPGLGMREDENFMAITNASKNKDAAFQVISTIVSNDVQMDMSKNGRMSVMKDKKIHDAFAADLDFVKGKNLKAIYLTKPAKSFPVTKFDPIGRNAINTALGNMVKKKVDVDTALRQAEESVNQQIQTKLGNK